MAIKYPTPKTHQIYQKDPYSVTELMKREPSEIRREYQRAYATAQKRLARFEEAGLYGARAYRENVDLPSSSKISDADMPEALNQVHRMLTAQTGSLRGYRASVRSHIQALRKNGIDFVNEENFEKFTEWMNANVDEHGKAKYSSEQRMQEFREKTEAEMEELEQSFDDFEPEDTEAKPRDEAWYRRHMAAVKGAETRRKNTERLRQAAEARGLDPDKIARDKFYRRNIEALEKTRIREGRTEAQYRRAINRASKKR